MNADLSIELLSNCLWMISLDKAINLCHLLLQTGPIPGAMVEFGVARGTTAMLMASLSSKLLYLYDSFQGLPDIPPDEKCHPGWRKGTFAYPASEVREGFKRYGLPMPVIHETWFADIRDDQLPAQISFAHLDGDLYSSTIEGLTKLYPRLVPGAVCVVDDYGWSLAQGVEAACTEFLRDKPETMIPLITRGEHDHHAFFIKD